MATIQIKEWNTQEVIFEYEGTIKEAVEEAVRQGISLAFADLSAAYLMGADLSGANLESANLYRANLNGAGLNGAILRDADLNYADLKGAILRDADLNYADLNSANLEGANLESANLEGANLKDANLKIAYLSFADLKDANLYNANIRYADLYGANLSEADFSEADLYAADLRFAKNIPNAFIPLACPVEGSFIAWKKVDDKLVKLEIPEDAKRCSATSKKCRCSKAKVLAITDFYEFDTYDEVVNENYVPLTYKVGEMVYPDSFDEDRWFECSHGIHFFMDKEDALNW